jgi:hypothetical protein
MKFNTLCVLYIIVQIKILYMFLYYSSDIKYIIRYFGVAVRFINSLFEFYLLTMKGQSVHFYIWWSVLIGSTSSYDQAFWTNVTHSGFCRIYL